MILLDSNRINRTLKRMAYQIVEEAHGAPIHLIGLNERGFAIASLIKPVIDKATGQPSPLEKLNADDEKPFNFEKLPDNSPMLVLIDDVIFSGATLQKSIDKIPGREDFHKICVAVLVDRGHRKFPVHAAIVGVNVPTKLNEQVNLLLSGKKPEKVVLDKS
jgi:pyrimidine operon attenuation protein / uracil phosphoribosyltransferase